MRKTTMQVATVVLVLTCARPLAATEVNRSEDELVVLLENQVKITYPVFSPMKKRLQKFLETHGVSRPAYYADIIDREKMTDTERKLFAAILIPETRGDANAVSKEGAVGPWQLHPCWFRKYGRVRSPTKNLKACLDVYRIHRQDTKSFDRALIAYSGGSRWYPRYIRRLMAEI